MKRPSTGSFVVLSSSLLGATVLGCLCILAAIGYFMIHSGSLEALSKPKQTAIPSHLPDPPTSTPSPTSTQTPTPTGQPSSTATLMALFGTAQPVELIAFMDAPEGPQPKPYVILSAFEQIPGRSEIELRGILDRTQEFHCPGARCEIPVEHDSVITFRAYANGTVASQPVDGTIRVTSAEQGYNVTVETTEPIWFFQDSCAELWGLQGSAPQDWNSFPQSPNLLNTKKELHYLATKLILAGAVDVSGCPGRGFGAEGPNQCAIDIASQALLTYQNQYDFNIWLAARDLGIPPRILKTLIETESQFWPGNARSFQDEIGLAQISEQGVDALLRWDKGFFTQLCPNVLSDCSKRYIRMPSELKAMLRGFVLQTMNAECPTCPYGMDMKKAQKSIQTIAQALRATCMDTHLIIQTYNYPRNYEDMWKFTLATYHSGLGCVEEAIRTSAFFGATKDWQNASTMIQCPGARDYVENFWNTLSNFTASRLPPQDNRAGLVAPEFLATRTPAPSATPYVSHARLRVQVYVDLNGNGVPDTGEQLDGIQVRVLLEGGQEMQARTVNGEAVFDLSGQKIGTLVIVNLPGLYRSYEFVLPESGEVNVPFRFEQPTLPTALP